MVMNPQQANRNFHRTGRRRVHIISAIIFFCCLAGTSVTASLPPQEARVNQKKIEREREKKHKQDMKAYNDAVKRHNKMQSKSTRAAMKKTKKESKKATPINR